MKKLLVALLVALTGFTSANAQIVEGLEYPGFHFGVRAGVTSNSFKDVDALTFPSGGLAVDFKIAPIPLYLETGLYYANKGCKYVKEWRDEKETSANHSVILPLVASYHLYLTDNMSVQPFFGGFYSYGFSSDNFLTSCYDEDYGLRFGCGFNYGRLYANVGYDLGLKNYADGLEYRNGDGEWVKASSIKSGMLFLTVGFNFIGSY